MENVHQESVQDDTPRQLTREERAAMADAIWNGIGQQILGDAALSAETDRRTGGI
jgi:hypothetical protein